jgi:hypothetical protein
MNNKAADSHMPIHGILTIEDTDNMGEIIIVQGVQLDPVRARGNLAWASGEDSGYCGLNDVMGRVTKAEPVYDASTESDPKLRELAAGKPFIKVEAEVFGEGSGKRLQAALIKGVELYFGLAGKLLTRDGNRLTECVVEDVLVTAYPSHRAQRIFLGRLV